MTLYWIHNGHYEPFTGYEGHPGPNTGYKTVTVSLVPLMEAILDLTLERI